MSAEDQLARLELDLPETPESLGLYRPVLIVGTVAYLSGHLPLNSNGSIVTGRLGEDLDVPAGQSAARLAGLATLATLRKALGSLNRVRRLIKTFGLVQCTSDFVDQPAVVNGFSELMRDVFGEDHGIGARSAVGVDALPTGSAVEIESIFEIEP